MPPAEAPAIEPVAAAASEPVAEAPAIEADGTPREQLALVVLVLDRSVADPFGGDMKNAHLAIVLQV